MPWPRSTSCSSSFRERVDFLVLHYSVVDHGLDIEGAAAVSLIRTSGCFKVRFNGRHERLNAQNQARQLFDRERADFLGLIFRKAHADRVLVVCAIEIKVVKQKSEN